MSISASSQSSSVNSLADASDNEEEEDGLSLHEQLARKAEIHSSTKKKKKQKTGVYKDVHLEKSPLTGILGVKTSKEACP